MKLCVETLSHVIVKVEVDRSNRVHSSVVAGKRGCRGFVDGGVDIALLNSPTFVALSEDGSSAIIVDSGNRLYLVDCMP